MYIRAAFAALFGYIFAWFPLGLIVVVAMVAGGYGIANERKWGYRLAVAVSVLALVPYVLVLAVDGLGALFDLNIIIFAMFPIAQFALLVHPQSRDYQRIWFH